MKVRVILTLSLICAFFILSWQSHDQNEDQLFGNEYYTSRPDDSKVETIKKLCSTENDTNPEWASSRDACSLNCDPNASYQGNPGGSASSLFFLCPIIWTLWTRNDNLAEWHTRIPFYLVLSFNFICLTIGSLFFHATRTQMFWQIDITFTLLSTWALFHMEVFDWVEREKRATYLIPLSLILYFGSIIPLAFTWSWWEILSGNNRRTFEIATGISTGLLFLTMLSVRLQFWKFINLMVRQAHVLEWWNLQKKNLKFNYLLILTGIICGIFGALLLDANLKKENEDNETALYFCGDSGIFSSLSIGHILLSVTLTAVCITFQYPIDIISVTNKKSAKISTKVGFLHF